MNDPIPEGWQRVERPLALFRRFEFAHYGETRAFLDLLAALSERTGLYPNLSFAKTYVNVTVPAGETQQLGSAEIAFAQHAAECALKVRATDQK